MASSSAGSILMEHLTENHEILLAQLRADPALAQDVLRWMEQSNRVGRQGAFVAYRQAAEAKDEGAEFQLRRRLGESTNRLFHGDNQAVLRELADEGVEARCIYIDPPFGTQQQFVTKVDHEWAYCDAASGSEYLAQLRERLVLLREILAGDGTIFVHLDSAMVAEVKILMDELFGRSNFRAWLTRRKCSSKNFTRRTFGDISDYVLVYSKAKDYVWNRPFQPRGEAQEAIDFPKVDQESGRRFALVPVHAPGPRRGASGSPWRGVPPPPGKHWQWTPDQLEEFDRKGDIHWTRNGTPRRKMWADESKGSAVQNILLNFRDPFTQNHKITGYPTEKNIDLLTLLISAATNPSDLVVDCFAGSGTTLEAAATLGRRWIGADIGAMAIATVQRRLTDRAFNSTLLETHDQFGFELWVDESLRSTCDPPADPWFLLVETSGKDAPPEILRTLSVEEAESVKPSEGQRLVSFDRAGGESVLTNQEPSIHEREKRPA